MGISFVEMSDGFVDREQRRDEGFWEIQEHSKRFGRFKKLGQGVGTRCWDKVLGDEQFTWGLKEEVGTN